MKEINSMEREGFKPVILKIETAEELCALWHRLNISSNSFTDAYGDNISLAFTVGCSELRVPDMWEVIDKIVKRKNLKAEHKDE